MGGFTARIPSRVFAARDVCRSLDLSHKELRRVANRLWYHRSEIGYGDLSRISVKLKTLPGVSKALTNENVIRLLHEENIATKFIVPEDEKTEVFNMVKKTKEFMKNLAQAKDTDEIWRIFGQIITETGIGSGCGVYAINSAGEIQDRGRLGFKGPSRYHDWTPPKGEKAQIIFIYDVIAKSHERLTGPAKVEYIRMLKEMKFWHLQDREKWPELGLDKTILLKALDASGLNKLNSGFLGLFLNSKAGSLVEGMIGTVNEKLCLTDDLIDVYCGEAYKKFLEKENIIDQSEKDEFQKTYGSILEKIKATAKEALYKAFVDIERCNRSRNFLKSRGMNELSQIINDGEEQRSFSIFTQSVHNYTEALEDIEGDKNRLKLTAEKGVPKRIKENFYYLVTGTDLNPIALVLANKHEENIKTGESRRIFEGEEGNKKLLIS